MAGALALLALAIAGQACALQLIDVKPYADFQHYVPWSALRLTQPAVLVVVLQAAIVAVLAWRWRVDVWTNLVRSLPARAWLVVLVMGGASLVVPTVSVARTAGEALLAGSLAIVALVNLALVVIRTPPEFASRLERMRAAPAVVAAFVTVVAAGASYFALERLPHIDDSVSNLFHAKYFASGHLYLPAPPDAEAFRMDLTVVHDGKWFGYAFPGWPAVLAIGVLAGAPWLVNPILGGVLILLAHAWVSRRWDRGTANVTILLLATSPWLIFMSAEMMGHPLSAVLTMLALVAFDRALAGGRATWWALPAGAAIGALFLTRSFDAILVAAAIGVIGLVQRRAWRPLLVTAAATVVVGALIFPYNRAVTGRANYPAHELWADGRYGPGVDVIGFGPKVGIDRWPNLDPLPGHGAADVALNLNKNLFMTNADLFGWATGSLLLVWIAFGLGRWRRNDLPLLIVPGIFIAGYSAFWFSGGPDLGARYWYPLLVPFGVLTARGAQMWSDAASARGLIRPSAGMAALLVAASIGAAVTVLPWRATTKHYRYRGITGEVRALAASAGFNHALVFIRSDQRSDFQSGFVLNPRTLAEPGTIYALDAGPEHTAAVVRHFSDRAVWVIGRRETPAGDRPFVVLEGPLPPGTLPK